MGRVLFKVWLWNSEWEGCYVKCGYGAMRPWEIGYYIKCVWNSDGLGSWWGAM